MGVKRPLALGAAALLATTASAQQPATSVPTARATAYGKVTQLPDWSGVWSPGAGRAGRTPLAKPVLTPAGAKLLADYEAGKAHGENLQLPAANCVPTGMPGIMRQPYPIEFVYGPGVVYILHETFSQVRRIYTDGRPLPEDPDPFFNGHSVGHWEGDTLVIDTVGISPMVNLVEGIKATEKSRIRERFTRTAADKLTDEITLTDPTLFAEPYVTTQTYTLKPDWEMREYVCQENNHDAADPFGRPSMSIDEKP